ncbi:MAG: aldolase [Gammaproteobacteria bacterium]|nr:aldolase [Gammaproteobacteria bacterium]
MSKTCKNFRKRLRAGDEMMGTFQKTPSAIVSELLTYTALDLVCIDTEHAPFGRLETDGCVAALRAAGKPSIVRIADQSAREVRNALDCGATGVLVPHVVSAKQAKRVVERAHFGEGGRGFAGSTRASAYTTKRMPDHLADSASETTVIVQIEDLAALENVSEIAAVKGVDAIFVGRADLAVAMNCSAMDNEVIDAVKRICNQARDVDAVVGMFTPDVAEIPMWREHGTSFYLLGSDQSMILSGARSLQALIKS